jgi:L-threonylcarbamoyladenylate synthase
MGNEREKSGVDIERAAALLTAGELVAIPTETVYGLAGNALNEHALAKIFAVKNRPAFDPLIVHTDRQERLQEWARDIPETARALARVFMPGPLTLLLPRRACIPDLVTAGSPLVALRIPDHAMALALLARLPFPLAAPSANPFGYISPTTAGHVARQLGDKIAYILDGGPCRVGLESTIIGFPGGRPVIYRKGGAPVEAIEALIGPVEVQPHSSSNPLAPGMLKSHYAPRATLVLGDIDALLRAHAGKRVGILSFDRRFPQIPPEQQRALAPDGDLEEAARRLFAALRHLDEQDLDIIIAEPAPEKGLGRAINDRLRRAAAANSATA